MSLKDKLYDLKDFADCSQYLILQDVNEDVKEAVFKLNSVKFGFLDIIMEHKNCNHKSRLIVVEYDEKKCNMCWDCLKKEIFGDFEK